MMTILLAIGGGTLLFLAAAFLRLRAGGCGSDCGACERPCMLEGDHDGSP